MAQSPLDPFSLVADEISSVSERLRRTIMSDIPVLSKAAEYFFQARLAYQCERLLGLGVLQTSVFKYTDCLECHLNLTGYSYHALGCHQ